MKKPEINLFQAAGTVLVAGSAIAIADYAIRKKKGTAHAAELVFGIAGVLIGTALASEPHIRSVRERVIVDDLFNEEDAELVHEQIRETLNKDPETVTSPTERLRTIEVDDETSIEDFI